MASSRVPENWKEWLKNHNSNEAYDAKPKEVSKLCNLADEVKITKCLLNVRTSYF